MEHRVADPRILRLIQKWLKAGVMEEGKWSEVQTGSPQGSVISPLLANIYLHYSFDLWVNVWRRKYAQGEVVVIRYADDTIVGFQYQTDADHFLENLRERLGKFGLELHPDKTRRIEFGRFAEQNRERRGEGKPETFDFLGSISVLLSNVYLHYVLDLWFERVAKPRLRGEAYLVRYIDDFVLCFQYRADALRVQKALCQRLRKFGLTLEPTKTKLVEFGRFAQRHASKRGRNRPQTIYFLGFTLYCTRNRKGNFRVGLRTEKSRLRRSLMRLQDQMRRMRHLSIREQADILNQMLRGHYAYYGIAGNIRALQRVHRVVERYWRIMLSSRSWKGEVLWKQFQQIKERFPLVRPKLYLPYSELQAIAVL